MKLILYSLFILIFVQLIGCQKSYRVLSHGEIHSAYRQNDSRYIPRLKEVVEDYNRDLGANAMYQLGNYYRDLALKDRDGLSREEEEIFLDLENYFIANTDTDLDFNLKNIVYRNLMFSSNPQVLKIYEEVLQAPVADNNPKRENVAAILSFIGERGRWLRDIDFDQSFLLCQLGVNSSDPLLFATGLACWSDLYHNSPTTKNLNKLSKELAQYREQFQGRDIYRHNLIRIYQLQIENGLGV